LATIPGVTNGFPSKMPVITAFAPVASVIVQDCWKTFIAA
jgi:hypothetical protein